MKANLCLSLITQKMKGFAIGNSDLASCCVGNFFGVECLLWISSIELVLS